MTAEGSRRMALLVALYGAKTQVAHFLRVLTPPGWLTLLSLTQKAEASQEGLSDSSKEAQDSKTEGN